VICLLFNGDGAAIGEEQT